MHTWSTKDSHGELIKAIGYEEIQRIPNERAQGVDTVVYHRATKPNPFVSRDATDHTSSINANS